VSAGAGRDPGTSTGVEAQIAVELDRVQQDSYGAGSRRVEVVIGPDLIMAIMDVELNRAEQTLMDSGQGTAVKEVRESFQEAIGPTFKAIVERATGRKVTSFMSMMSIDPLYAVEVFRLRPTGQDQETAGGSR
jgi:uncharacterized protein YbcI